MDADDLLAWKDWVESRLRQLTLKVQLATSHDCVTLIKTIIFSVLMIPYDVLQVERCTNGKLLCIPWPSGYVDDKSRQSYNCIYFMGLRKKPGVGVEVIDMV